MNHVALLSAVGTCILHRDECCKSQLKQPTPFSLRIYSIRKCLQQGTRNKNGFILYLALGYNIDKTYKRQTEFLNLHRCFV